MKYILLYKKSKIFLVEKVLVEKIEKKSLSLESAVKYEILAKQFDRIVICRLTFILYKLF